MVCELCDARSQEVTRVALPKLVQTQIWCQYYGHSQKSHITARLVVAHLGPTDPGDLFKITEIWARASCPPPELSPEVLEMKPAGRCQKSLLQRGLTIQEHASNNSQVVWGGILGSHWDGTSGPHHASADSELAV